MRTETFKGWWRDSRDWATDLKRELSGEKERDKQRIKRREKESHFV